MKKLLYASVVLLFVASLGAFSSGSSSGTVEQDNTLEVLHWWTSGGEAAALLVLPVVGRGGRAAPNGRQRDRVARPPRSRRRPEDEGMMFRIKRKHIVLGAVAVVVLGVILSELTGPFFTRNILQRAGEISPRVEEALAAAVERADFTVMEKLLCFLSQPYQDPPEQAGYHLPPPPSAQPYRTFCGT